jgi:hypothetical protein
MRAIARWFLLAAVVSGAVVMWGVHQSRGSSATAQAPIRLTRIYSGSDGQTHAQEIEVKLGASVPNIPGLQQSPAVKVSSAYFARFVPDFFEDWHNAHARRYVITLTGRGEVEIGSGQKITLEPGRVLLAEDLTGKGHITRALTPDWTALFVQFDP